VGAPLERIALDVLGPLPLSKNENKYILVITDYFTRWAEAYPMKNQETKTIADLLINEFVCRFGIPHQIHTDQGRQFESSLFQNLCKRLNIDKTRTTPYHPQGDGLVERLNRTIESMLSKVISSTQKDWDEFLPLVMYAYRSSVHESTGETPAMMMFGRELDLPVDLLFGNHTCDQSDQDVGTYLETFLEKMWKTHDLAREQIAKSSDKQKRQYDLRSTSNTFSVGEAVWLFNPFCGKGKSPKLKCKWDGPYTVVRKLSDLVYQIQKGPKFKSKVVNRNRLKPYVGNVKRWFVPTIPAQTRSQQ
jgi:hypothetical protein